MPILVEFHTNFNNKWLVKFRHISAMLTVRHIIIFSVGAILLFNVYLLSSFINKKFNGEFKIVRIERLTVGSKVKLSTPNTVLTPGQKEEAEIFTNEIDAATTTDATDLTMDGKTTADVDNKDYDSEEIERNWLDRRLKLQKFCRARSNDAADDSNDQMEKAIEKIFSNRLISDHFYVDELNEVLYSVMWKAGSSAWLYLLSRASLDTETLQPMPASFWQNRELHIFGNTSNWTKNLSTRPLSLFVDLKSQLGREKMREVLKTYTKVILVRHPLTRLVSAYQDKFRHGNNVLYKAIGCSIVKMARNQSLNVENVQKQRCEPTLEEFFIYLNKTTRPDFIFDAHWTTYQTLALPCWINYDIIMKMEHWFPEIGYCFNKIHHKPVAASRLGKNMRRYDEQVINGEDFQNRFHDRPEMSHDKYMNKTRQLPENLVEDVRRLFQFDFEAFNYE